MAKKADPSRSANNKVVATNRKARHNYSILETFEAGVQLVGTEVKSLRDGQASLADSFATVDDGEVWLRNLHIPEYHHGSWTNHPPRRNRKLLLHRSQIDNLIGRFATATSPWFRCRCTSPTARSRSSWRWREVRKPATSGRTWPNAMRTARSPASSAAAPKG